MGAIDVVRNPRTYLRNTVSLYWANLFDPQTFYEERVGRVGLLRELLLVTVVGLAGTAGTYYAVETLRAEFGDLPRDVNMQLWGEALSPLVGAFVLWVAFSLALYAVSWLYSTAGSVYLHLKYTAWSLVPLLIGNLVMTAGFAITASTVEIDSDGPLPSLTESAVAFIWEQIYHEPLVLATYAIGSLFFVWSAYIAAHGVAEIRQLEMDEAYRVVAIPLAGYLLYVAYGIASAAL